MWKKSKEGWLDNDDENTRATKKRHAFTKQLTKKLQRNVWKNVEKVWKNVTKHKTLENLQKTYKITTRNLQKTNKKHKGQNRFSDIGHFPHLAGVWLPPVCTCQVLRDHSGFLHPNLDPERLEGLTSLYSNESECRVYHSLCYPFLP